MSKSRRERNQDIISDWLFYSLLVVLCVGAYFSTHYLLWRKSLTAQTVSKNIITSMVTSPNGNLPTAADTVTSAPTAVETNPAPAANEPTAPVVSSFPPIVYHPDNPNKSNTAVTTPVAIANPDALPNIADPSLSFGSFFNNFVSASSIDNTKTTLYRDKTAVAIFFPPDYGWQSADDSTVAQSKNDLNIFHFNNFTGPYNDERCLGNNCLKQQDNSLYYNGQHLNLPAAINSQDVIAVTIGAISNRWLIGLTLKDGTKYQGQVFYFDGQNFSPLLSAGTTPGPISSVYSGLFGFGGEANDFLVIYGGYEGKAYRVRGSNLTDISQFFPIRVMDGGFKAEAIKTVNRNEVNWYVFSLTSGRPWLMKLWQNGTSDIVGEAVFKDFISASTQSAAFKLLAISANQISLLAKITNDNADSWQVFTDRGFKNEAPGTLVFTPIANNGVASPMSIKKIAISDLGLDQTSASLAQFSFSADGSNWQNIPSGKNIDFTSPVIRYFFLKVAFPAFQDKFYSPFLTSVSFDYYCQK